MSNIHWQYFLTLDQDLLRLSRFIEVTPTNYSVYSVELVRIVLAACSEIDVVAKQMYQTSKRRPDICDHRDGILAKFPNLPTVKAVVPAHSITLQPWAAWQSQSTPTWWSDHNDVKHSRQISYQKANLRNALDAVGGLLVLLVYQFEAEWRTLKLQPRPDFIALEDQYDIHDVVVTGKPLP